MSALRFVCARKSISVFAHEDTNNFIFTKYVRVLFQILILCTNTDKFISNLN